jgi:hypothetical protein
MNEAECRAMVASGYAGSSFGDAHSDTVYPRGCYLYSSGVVYFNSGSGGARASSRPICKSDTYIPDSPADSGTGSYRVVVLGDVHGDYDNMIAALRNTGILNSRNEWRSTTDKVISLGDLIGRGHQDRQVLEFVYTQMQSRPRQWIQLLGNHEIMQVRGDWRYAVDSSSAGFGSLSSRQSALARGSRLGDWLRGLPVIHREADNLFMHAGMADERNIGRSMSSLNTEVTRFITGASSTRTAYNDLVWDRTLISDAFNRVSGICSASSSKVPRILSTHGAARMFVGHTVVSSSSLAGRNQRTPLSMCSGRMWGIDTGLSRWMNSNPQNVVLNIASGSSTLSFVSTSSTGRRMVTDAEMEYQDALEALDTWDLSATQLKSDMKAAAENNGNWIANNSMVILAGGASVIVVGLLASVLCYRCRKAKQGAGAPPPLQVDPDAAGTGEDLDSALLP